MKELTEPRIVPLDGYPDDQIGLHLAPMGFDLREYRSVIRIGSEVTAASYVRNGGRYVVVGSPAQIAKVLRAAGYDVIE